MNEPDIVLQVTAVISVGKNIRFESHNFSSLRMRLVTLTNPAPSQFVSQSVTLSVILGEVSTFSFCA